MHEKFENSVMVNENGDLKNNEYIEMLINNRKIFRNLGDFDA